MTSKFFSLVAIKDISQVLCLQVFNVLKVSIFIYFQLNKSVLNEWAVGGCEDCR